MRPSTVLRAGAVVTASVLTLSLGAGPATADASATTTGARLSTSADQPIGASSFAAGSSAARGAGRTTVDVTYLKASSALLRSKGNNKVQIAIAGDAGTSPGGAQPAKTELTIRINGKNHTGRKLYPGPNNSAYINTKSYWGTGRAQLVSTKVTYTDGATSTDGKNSNKFRLRSRVRTTAKYPLTVKTYSPGKKIKFEARSWKYFKPSSGSYRSIGKIRVQYKKSGHWKTLKAIKLNSKGSGSYTTKISGTRTYRLYVPKSSKLGGAKTETVTAKS